jgi:hypothetical protein
MLTPSARQRGLYGRAARPPAIAGCAPVPHPVARALAVNRAPRIASELHTAPLGSRKNRLRAIIHWFRLLALLFSLLRGSRARCAPPSTMRFRSDDANWIGHPHVRVRVGGTDIMGQSVVKDALFGLPCLRQDRPGDAPSLRR